jgi:hypothetical protein
MAKLPDWLKINIGPSPEEVAYEQKMQKIADMKAQLENLKAAAGVTSDAFAKATTSGWGADPPGQPYPQADLSQIEADLQKLPAVKQSPPAYFLDDPIKMMADYYKGASYLSVDPAVKKSQLEGVIAANLKHLATEIHVLGLKGVSLAAGDTLNAVYKIDNGGSYTAIEIRLTAKESYP